MKQSLIIKQEIEVCFAQHGYLHEFESMVEDMRANYQYALFYEEKSVKELTESIGFMEKRLNLLKLILKDKLSAEI